MILKKKKFLFIDARYHLVAQNQCQKSITIVDTTKGFEKAWKLFLREHKIKKLGFEGAHLSYKMWHRLQKISHGTRLVDIGDKLNGKRMIKSEIELRSLYMSQKINEEVFAKIKRWLRPGLTEKQIGWKIEKLAHLLGADGVSFKPIVAINENSASPHHENTDRRLKRGDMILVDMGVIYDGYCSDMTRIIFTANPTAEQKKIYELVLRAQETVTKKLRAGIKGSVADNIARSLFKRYGLDKQFSHALGHGVGLDIHELPNLSQAYSGTLKAGCVVTVEPGIYLPGKFGIRIEDMVLIKKKGIFNLTKAGKKLKSCIIRI